MATFQLLCAHSSYLLLHWINNLLIPKIYFPQCIFCAKIIHLQNSYLFIRCYKTRFFYWKTNANRSGVKNQTNTLYFLSSSIIYFGQEQPIKVLVFEVFEYSSQNLLNSSCQFWNNKPIPFQILHHSSLPWHVTLL